MHAMGGAITHMELWAQCGNKAERVEEAKKCLWTCAYCNASGLASVCDQAVQSTVQCIAALLQVDEGCKRSMAGARAEVAAGIREGAPVLAEQLGLSIEYDCSPEVSPGVCALAAFVLASCQNMHLRDHTYTYIVQQEPSPDPERNCLQVAVSLQVLAAFIESGGVCNQDAITVKAHLRTLLLQAAVQEL